MKTYNLLPLLLMSSLIGTLRGNTPLILAIHEENASKVALLLKDGANPNEPGIFGEKPLYSALIKKDPIFAKILLEHNANPNDTHGRWKPLDTAIHHGTEEHVKLLMKHGADISQINETFNPVYFLVNKPKSNNLSLIQAETRRRCTTLLLSIKATHPDTMHPQEMISTIRSTTEAIVKLVSKHSDQAELEPNLGYKNKETWDLYRKLYQG